MLKETNIHFFGPQGSGKGTQAELLAKRLTFCYVSIGQLFRNASRQINSLAKKISNQIRQGDLMSDDLFLQVLTKFIKNNENRCRGFVFDGAMRNINQMKILQPIWNSFNYGEPLLIVLIIPDDIAVKRLSIRLTCDYCGFISSQELLETNSVCKQCKKGKMIGRADDRPKSIQKRLRVYHQETQPVIESFKKKNRAIFIDGTPDITTIADDVYEKFNNYQRNVFN